MNILEILIPRASCALYQISSVVVSAAAAADLSILPDCGRHASKP